MKNQLYPALKLLAAGTLLTSCTPQQGELPPPNILWISAEDISPAFGCYGDDYASTPNIDQLAENGIVYTQAFATAPICAPARSALITGRHAATLGTQHLRSDIPVPDSLMILPEYLRKAGYFTSNNSKTDYNFDPSDRWDELGNQAHWQNRPDGSPFFSVFNYGTTHEGNTNKFTDQTIEGLTEMHDPTLANLPPYFPDTGEMRTIWAHAYDLITKFDMQVGQHVKELEEAGELENTLIFVFSDHGFGLPRYKRWLYKTGIHVPLVVYVPDKYKDWFDAEKGSRDDRLISFVDFAPTVMTLAGLDPDPQMHGSSFAGKKNPQRDYIYAARSRADDVYDVSRLIMDQRYVYIRNFMPYKPYIQDALIFGPSKRSFRELNPLAKQGKLNDTVMRMYTPKPTEELYDLKNDPFELQNLANDPAHADKLSHMSQLLKNHLIDTRDAGFLHESEMMIRASGSSIAEMASDPLRYDVENIINAAWSASVKNTDPEKITLMLTDPDAGVRFWGLNALANSDSISGFMLKGLQELTNDPSPACAILAAELCILNEVHSDPSYRTLMMHLQDQRPWVVLNAAISIRRIGEKVKPILPFVKEEVEKYYGDKGAGYSSWVYPMFTGFALDQAILNGNGDSDTGILTKSF